LAEQVEGHFFFRSCHHASVVQMTREFGQQQGAETV